MTSMIYHYTSAPALLGIIRNGEFWATDINFLNDHQEHVLGYKMSMDVLHRLKSEIFDETLDEWFELFYSKMVETSVANIIDRPSYVVSFSSTPDSIAHWFSYCEKNQGYAIGFKEEEFFAESQANQKFDYLYSFEDVNYGDMALLENRLERILSKNAINNRMTNFQDTLNKLQIDVHSNTPFVESQKAKLGQELVQDIFRELIFSSTAFKEAGFKHECERRLIICSGKKPNNGHHSKLTSSFREKGGVIYPYATMKFNTKSIKEIIIGPCKDFELKKAGLIKLIESAGIDCEIRSSDSSLRFN